MGESKDACVAGHCAPVAKEYPHCNDNVSAFFPGQDTVNGFPVTCPRPEGIQATTNPFEPPARPGNKDSYLPVALINRFDLAPSDGASCGEYRIIFAKQSGVTKPNNRNLIIFEGVLPNARINQGLAGCLPVATLWDGLSGLNAAAQATALQNFYFNGLNPNDGLPPFEPVVNPNHYGAQLGTPGYGANKGCSSGQIRTDQFMVDGSEGDPPNGSGWTLREFKLVQDCRCTPNGNECPLVIVPMSVKQNPFGDLFNSASPLLVPPAEYQNFETVGNVAAGKPGDFTVQVTNKQLGDANPLLLPFNTPVPVAVAQQTFTYVLRHDFDNAGESQSEIPPGAPLDDYNVALDPGFTATLTAQIGKQGIAGVTSAQIFARTRSLSCAGCHELSGTLFPNNPGFGGGMAPFPASLGFTHISEVAKGANFPLSLALTTLFLPDRVTLLENFIANPPPPKPTNFACPKPFSPPLQVNCPIAPDVDRFPIADLRLLEPELLFPINGFSLL